MMSFLLVIHVTICILLIITILIQAGRGGGLVEAFSGVESMFGTKTNALLTKMTTILASLFFICCLSLAILSARQSKSLMRNVPEETTPAGETSGQTEKTAPIKETPVTEGTEKPAAEPATAETPGENQPSQTPKAEVEKEKAADKQEKK